MIATSGLNSRSFGVQQIRFWPGLFPDPVGGAYSALPDPISGLRGPISKGKEGEGKGRGKKGRLHNANSWIRRWIGLHSMTRC